MKNKLVFLTVFAASIGFAAAPATKKASTKPVAPAVKTNTEATPSSPASGTASTTITGAPSASDSGFLGDVDVRPSMTIQDPGSQNKAEYHNEIYPELGYQIKKDLQVWVEQDFNTNIYNPVTNKGFGFVISDTIFKVKLNNLYNDGKGFSFGYEPRLYVPTSSASRDAGLISYVRNYLKFSKTVSDTLTLTAMEIPIFAAFSRAGTGTSANWVFENRVYLIADIAMFKGKLNASIPLMFHQTKYREYAPDGKLGGNWGYTLWSWPELIYSVTPKVGVGLAFETDNMVAPDLSGFTFDNAFNHGVAQIVLRAAL